MADKAKKAAEATEKDVEKSVKAEETPDATPDASETPSEKDNASKKGSSTTKRTKKSASKDSDKEASGKGASSKESSNKGASGKASSNKGASGKASKSSTRRKSEKKDTSDTGDEATAQLHAPGSNRWVVPTFVTLALLGVLWMVVFYISSTANIDIPVMSDIGYWNLAIGMGLLAVSLGLTTQWK
ncbi:cell division protein CrgA [Propioniferax innocua]|uniref:Cell division protein CrgA n=1 Tax=Propioniferax innocua TaxID=1753 RepID=A0A542ZT32_9ACTN|nr:cell division protein CrgA [Propioniferax innocua]TQL63447.1 uncharacterized protein UPF0233 [Propioniferax innocua]